MAKKWEFTYKTKDGRERIVNNENCWKHLEEDLWRGLTWCGDHLGACLLGAGAVVLTGVAIAHQKKVEEQRDIDGAVIFVEVAEAVEEVAKIPSITTEHSNNTF